MGQRRRGEVIAVLAGAVAAVTLVGCGNRSATSAPSPGRATASFMAATPAAGSPQVLTTYHYGNARQGVDSADPSFRKLARAWTASGAKISGDIYAEPLIYGGRVYVVTENDDVYALKASTGAVEWKVNIGAAVQATWVGAPGMGSSCGDIRPLGITGTPVIDAKSGVLYVAAEVQRAGTSTWRGIEHVMTAIRLSDHRTLWHRQIDPPNSGDGTNGTYIIGAEQQRSALSLVRGRVYVEYGGLSGDCAAYHGYAVSTAESGTGALGIYKTPSPREDALWAMSGAAADESGNLYVATGNGANGPGQKFDYGNAVIKLSGSLKVLSHYAPSSWAYLSQQDLDLGSDGPTLLPGERLLFQSGKAGFASGNGGTRESWGYLLNPASLGGIGHPLFRGQVCPSPVDVFGSNATAVVSVGGTAKTLVFVPCPSGTVALAVTTGSHPSFHRIWAASQGNPNGPPILAGGLVWAISTGADGGGGPSSVLYGMSPGTGKVLVTEQFAAVDHFVTPGAGDGIIVVGTTAGVEAFKP